MKLTRTHAAALVGRWKMTGPDASTGADRDVEVEFHPDGNLTYAIRLSHEQQLIFLTWRLEDDFVVTNQASQPNEVRSRVVALAPAELVLEFAGIKTRLVRLGPLSST